MARSSSIYIIQEILAPNGAPLAAFTVKHEAKTFLEKRAKRHPIRQPVFIYKLGDNNEESVPRVFTEKEFMER